ncbi:MAG: hypothetical protein RMZ42_06895 [Nostoc sp. DedQUE05]|nr:hypothetical protein [Nostoc sp. DedQUE05]MDZ8091652.1 hypothetical protein [Nostoc sp. DedQUE05]
MYEIISPVNLTLYEKSLRCQAFLETCGRAIALGLTLEYYSQSCRDDWR